MIVGVSPGWLNWSDVLVCSEPHSTLACRSLGSHHPIRDIFWNSAGSMFADDSLAALFDYPMCNTPANCGSLKSVDGMVGFPRIGKSVK